MRREELLATTARCAAVVAAVSGTPLFLQILNTCLVVEDQDFAILEAMIIAFSPSHTPPINPFLRQKCIAISLRAASPLFHRPLGQRLTLGLGLRV